MSFIDKDGVKYSTWEKTADICEFDKNLTEFVMPKMLVDGGEEYTIQYIRGVSGYRPNNNIKKLFINDSFSSLVAVSDYFEDLEYVEVDENNPHFKSINGMIFSHDEKTLLFVPACCDIVDLSGCTKLQKISSYAFLRKKLSKVIFPDSVKEIAENAFYSCDNLKEVTIPKGVTKLPKTTFIYCDWLQSVIVPKTVKKLLRNTFSECPSLIVYCEHEEMPSDWNKDSFKKCEVVFGHKE